MPVYGQFETVAELVRTGLFSVYRARAADGGWDVTFGDLGSDANYVIKVLHPRDANPDAGEDDDANPPADEARRFLDRARSQRRAADAGAEHWAPIHDAGKTAAGEAYYVTNLYPRTVNHLIAAAPVDAATLYAVVAGTLDGLVELRATQGRPHGNVRPGNILIDAHAGAPVTADDVRLTDPAVEQDATIGGEVEDLYNLGEVIHRLVLRANFAGQHTWPVQRAAAWAALGKRGGEWLALCNRLLSPRAAQDGLRIEDVMAQVARLHASHKGVRHHRRRPARSRKVWVAAAALAVVAGLGAGEYVHYTRVWRDLCAAHDAWLGPLSERLAKETPREFAQDAYLNDRVVAPLADARRRGIELDPRRIAGGSDQPPRVLADRPPLSLGAVWETERAWNVVKKIDQSVSPDRWAATSDLARRRADYEKRGWPKLAQYAASLVGQSKAARGAEWVTAMTAALDGDERLARLDAARDAARTRLDQLVARAPSVSALRETLGRFEAHLRLSTDSDVSAPTPDAVDALARQLADADRVVARFDPLIPTLAEAAKLERVYDVRGWTGPARHLAALVDQAAPTADLAALTDVLAGTRKTWERVEKEWKEIEDRRRVLETSGDRILATYRQHLADARLADAPSLDALAGKLSDLRAEPTWAAVASKVSDDAWGKVDVVEFAQKSQVHRNFAGRTVATSQDLTQWLAEVEGRSTQLAGATLNPQAGGPDRAPVRSTPAPPTTVASSNSATRPASEAVASTSPPPAVTRPSPTAVASSNSKPPPVTQKSAVAVATTQDPATQNPATQRTATTLASADPRPSATATRPIPGGPPAPVATSQRVEATAIAGARPPTPTTITSVNQLKPDALAVAVPRDATTTAPRVESKPAESKPATRPAPTTVAAKPAPPPPDPEKVRREEEIRRFALECREIGLDARNAGIKQAWATKNEEIARRVEKDHALDLAAIKAERNRLRIRLLQLDSGYAQVTARLALPSGPSPWNAALAKGLQSAGPKWGETLPNLVDAAVRGDPRFVAAFDKMIANDEEWRGTAARFVADANRAAQLLADGYVPDDRTNTNAALASTLAAVRKSPIYQSDDVRQALEPLLRPVSVTETETDPGALRRLAASTDQPLGVRLAAWSKAGKAVSRAALEEDVKTAGSLLASAQARRIEGARIDSIKDKLELDVRGRWVSLLDNALSGEEIEAAMAMREKIPGVDPDTLPARARANFALRDLRAAVAAAKGDDLEKQVAPAAERFRKAIAALDPAQAKAPAVATVLGEIGRVGQGAPVDFTQLGPMSDAGSRAIRWTADADPSGEKVVYRGTPVVGGGGAGVEELVLAFRRVRPGVSSSSSSTGRSTWLCTTETSLGTFSDLLAAAGKWAEVRNNKWLLEYDPTRGDPRKGPRVWEWPRYSRTPDVTWTRVWLSVPDFVPRGLEHYPPGIAADFNPTQIGNPRSRDDRRGVLLERAPELNPSRRMPMQYVSARAAQFVASIAGCRLPTYPEWQAAVQSTEQAVGMNVRDRTWRLELEHLSRASGGRRPDAGMFVPAGERQTDDVWRHPTSGGELNDGILWFREAAPSSGGTPPGVFVDLIGNVAEFVTGPDAGKVYVIGTSAMSPPPRLRDPQKPYEVAADQLSGGFSDVGFRLAFTEPPVGIDRLKEAVAGNWYLTGK